MVAPSEALSGRDRLGLLFLSRFMPVGGYQSGLGWSVCGWFLLAPDVTAIQAAAVHAGVRCNRHRGFVAVTLRTDVIDTGTDVDIASRLPHFATP